MDGAELAGLLAGFSKLADDGAVQLHFENVAGDGCNLGIIVVRVRIRAVDVLMWPRRDADRPRRAHLIINLARRQIVVENLDPAVGPVADVNVALRVRREGVRKIELSKLRTARTDRSNEFSVLVVLRHARV